MQWHKVLFLVSLCSLDGLFLVISSAQTTANNALTCSIADEHATQPDPALKELTYDLGQGTQSILAYVTPDVTSFYPPGTKPPAKVPVKPKFKGLSAKFVNLSNKRVRLYW
jgi:hypothetical protein